MLRRRGGPFAGRFATRRGGRSTARCRGFAGQQIFDLRWVRQIWPGRLRVHIRLDGLSACRVDRHEPQRCAKDREYQHKNRCRPPLRFHYPADGFGFDSRIWTMQYFHRLGKSLAHIHTGVLATEPRRQAGLSNPRTILLRSFNLVAPAFRFQSAVSPSARTFQMAAQLFNSLNVSESVAAIVLATPSTSYFILIERL